MKIVMLAGTFDIFHPGHEYFLKEARKFGDFVVTIVARNETALRIKGREPKNGERKRMEGVKKSGLADKVILGNKGDIFNIIEEVKPEVICLGYDQPIDEKELKEELEKRKMKVQIIRLGAFKPEIYKSSFLIN